MPYGTINAGTIAPGGGNTLTVDGAWTAASQTCANLGAVTTADINGGTIDATTVGASSHTTGKFTTCDATTDFTIGGLVVTDGQIADTGTLALVPVDGCTIALGSGAGDDFNVDGGKLVVEGDNGLVSIGSSFSVSAAGHMISNGHHNNASLTLSRPDKTTSQRIFFQTTSSENDGQMLLGYKADEADITVTNHYGADADIFKWDASDGLTYVKSPGVSIMSDARLKKDVTDITDGLELLNQLRPVNFKFNGQSQMQPDDDKLQVGFIADEVETVAPFYVHETTDTLGATLILDEDGNSTHEWAGGEKVDDVKSLATGRFIPMIVKAIQELSAKVTALENA